MNGLPDMDLFYVDHLIAEGGTAKVYWGVDKRSGYPVAIKELKIKHFRNRAIRDNFKKTEAQMYVYLEHPSIPKLVDFIDEPQKEQMFIVMEFIEGRSLEQYIYREIGLIPEDKALPMFLDILDAVAYIHKKGYLHLDIKSSNVMIQPNGKIKLIDLGIASRMSEAGNTGFGTPAYMPPEQTEMRHCDKYTDIFSLGVMLFEMLTGTLPFTSQNPSARQALDEIRYKIKYEPAPSMRQFYPPMGEELQFIVDRAMAKEPLQRYQSCQEFKNSIVDYMRKKGIRNESYYNRKK